MHKQQAIDEISSAGDAIVTYRSAKSKKLKYNVVTLDFSNKHISKKHTHATEDYNTLLTFSWDTDCFRLLNCDQITSIVPLGAVLKNV